MTRDEQDEEPMIRFGGEWLPAHAVWQKMETVNVAVDAVNRFNEQFPGLASEATRSVVPLVRQRLKEIELRMPRKDVMADLAAMAADLLCALPPEDVVDTLRDQHGVEISLTQLIQLVGDRAYRGSLAREAREFEMNRVSPDQTAHLWNDAGRPAPGGGLWTARKISELLSQPS
jgi:hypothetical protein